MRISSALFIPFLFCLSGVSLPHPVRAGEWKDLFSEESLKDWEKSGNGRWEIREGMLTGRPMDATGCQIFSPQTYGDFELRFEYRVFGKREAGLLFRAHRIEGQIVGYRTLFDAPLKDNGGVILAGAGEETLVPPAITPEKPAGKSLLDWDSVNLKATQNQIMIEINGKEVANLKNNRYIGGHLVFDAVSTGEDRVGLIGFRNLKIRDLTDEEGYNPLFNGENLDGWKVHGEKDQWWVEGGEIHSESKGGEYSYLATEKQYKNFSIIGEFKALGDGNSGLFFHSHLDGTKISGIQSEVQAPTESRLGHSGCLYDSSGRGWLIDPNTLRPEQERVFKVEDWNTMRVDVKDHHITTWLNGLRIVDYFDKNPTHETGVIALQIHSGGGVKVNWRNVRLKELE